VESLVGALDMVTPNGLTPLIDAVYGGITLVGAEPGRSLVLVFSDGVDTASLLRQPQLRPGYLAPRLPPAEQVATSPVLR
jgi:hypothetical protein